MSKSRILLVEDDEALVATLREELEDAGYVVDPASTGEEALRKIEYEPPDLVLLDLLLPGELDGLDVLDRLRENARARTLPVVILSNIGDEEKVRSALALGATAYFIKTRHRPPEIVEHLGILLRPAAGKTSAR